MTSGEARPRHPRWTLLAPLVALGLLGLGLVLNAGSILYDDTHWDTVYEVGPRAAADRNGLEDLGGAVIGRLFLVVSGVALISLLASAAGLVRGKAWAHVSAGVVAVPFALCCGVPYVSGQGYQHEFDDPQYLNRRGSYAPVWVLVSDTAGPLLIVAGAVIALAVLLLPPVLRRFYRPRDAAR
jgi:hypothetical protein